jgi:hypothetical protein
MAYAYGPPMFSHDGLILDIPLEEKQSRTSDILARAKTTFPVAHQSIRDAQAQLHTGDPDISNYLSNVTRQLQPSPPHPLYDTTDHQHITPSYPSSSSSRQRLQNAITQLTTTAVIGTRIWCRMWD